MSRQQTKRQTREPTIALINIVFLMLVFFMVAGTLARPLDKGLNLVKTRALEGRAPSDALVIHPDGRITHAGVATDASSYLASLPEDARQTIRLVPDRDLPARTLVALSGELRAAGAERILIVTERGLE